MWYNGGVEYGGTGRRAGLWGCCYSGRIHEVLRKAVQFMNYNKILYDVTAMLLMLQVQMKEYSYSTVVYRYFCECGYSGRSTCDTVVT